MNYKIYWIVLCKDEADIIPYVIPYWRRVADRVIVYDNGSTDGSIELLSGYDWIEVKHFDSNGQNDITQKQVKERAYLEYKNACDVVIITDMDEIFYFGDLKPLVAQIIDGGYNILATPIYSLCEDFKPVYEEGKLLHTQCSKFFKQKMNHMQGFEELSKLSIFNTRVTDSIQMSVGQHYVKTSPDMRIILSMNDFCLHINKGFGEEYFVNKRKKMGNNLSMDNIRGGMCLEYLKDEEASRQEYRKNQENSINLNNLLKKVN